MDTESTKQIIIAYYAIGNAIDAMLKPIRIELNDAETMITMPQAQEHTLNHIKAACKGIQAILKKTDISKMEKGLDADEELVDAIEMISDILFDVQPKPNLVEFSSANHMANEAIGVAQRIGKALL